MTTFIALLRGINVSGKNLLKMVELKQLFIDIGSTEVVTYIQSGNIVFKVEETNRLKLEDQIYKAIKATFGYDIKVLVLTTNELSIAFNSNPFLNSQDEDITKLCVTFLSDSPNLEDVPKIEEIKSKSDDEFFIKDRLVYLKCPNGFGRTKLTNNLFERKLKVDATTRNWKTITKLIALSS